MRPELGGWASDGVYLTPPWVLVLRVSGHLPNALRVAQVYSDATLMGEGDVALPGSLGGFAEPWNVYTIQDSDLDRCWGETAAGFIERFDRVRATLQAAEPVLSSDGEPATAVARDASAPAATEEPVLLRFRKLEVDVGYRFSSKAVAALVARAEASGSPSFTSEVSELARILSFSPQRIIGTASPSLLAAAAASTAVEFYAPLDRGGHVSLSLEPSGKARASAFFDHPEVAYVALVDSLTGAAIPFTFAGSSATMLELPVGSTKEVVYSQVADHDPIGLRLVVAR